MPVLITTRIFQGIGSGGVFALVYIVLSVVSSPENRGRTLSIASSIWGIASVLGPTLGGFLVTYVSWRWIFWINIPLGIASFWGDQRFFDKYADCKARGKIGYLGRCNSHHSHYVFPFRLPSGRPKLSMVEYADHRSSDYFPDRTAGFYKSRRTTLRNRFYLSNFSNYEDSALATGLSS